MAKSLLALEKSLGLGSVPPRRRRAGFYDERRSIALRADPQVAGEPMFDTRHSHKPAESTPPPTEPAAQPAPPLPFPDPRKDPAWTRLASPSEPEPPPEPEARPAAPPAEKQPAFTARDDEAAAAAFSEGPKPVLAESRSADAAEFLTRALVEAPAPGPVAAQNLPAEPDDEEASEAAAFAQPQVAYGHDVFERMAGQAEQFDLGAVALDLESAFNAFDQEQDEEQAARFYRAAAESRPLPTVGHVDTVADLAEIHQPEDEEEEEEHEDEAAFALGDAQQSFHVLYDVPLVPQQTGMSCWAAGAAMLVAWRDQMSVDPSAIANAIGYWEQYKSGLDAEDTTMFKTWGLVPEPPQTYTVQAFRELLERWGPLWVASAEPGPHVRVVHGLSGDGTADGTIVHILDPWEPGMQAFRQPNAGGRYTETYADFERKQASLARSESQLQGIYVAHVDRERRTP